MATLRSVPASFSGDELLQVEYQSRTVRRDDLFFSPKLLTYNRFGVHAWMRGECGPFRLGKVCCRETRRRRTLVLKKVQHGYGLRAVKVTKSKAREQVSRALRRTRSPFDYGSFCATS